MSILGMIPINDYEVVGMKRSWDEMRRIVICTGFSLLLGCVEALARPAEPARLGVDAARTAAFSPGVPDAERLARLDALGPTLDTFFRSKLSETGATGLAVGIVMDGALGYARGFGVQDVDSGAPVDQDSVFRIASLTK